MKAAFTFLAAGLALVLTGVTARAEFEMWKSKEGKATELEIAEVKEGASGTEVHFRTKAGKAVTLKLEDLAADAQARVKDWKTKPPVEATFAYATNGPATGDAGKWGTQLLEFVFDLKGDCALLSRPKISNPTVSVAGKKLEVLDWSCLVYDGSFESDPMTSPPPALPKEWSIIVTAMGNFPEVEEAAVCEFSADVEVMCGKSPKEVVTTMPLPADPAHHLEVKEVEPFSIRMVRTDYPVPDKKGETATGYFLVVMPGEKKIDLGDGVLRPAFSEAFIVNGKEHPRCVFKDQVTDPAKVVVKYWSEAYKVPLHLSKAASNTGRTPSRKGLIDGMPREGSGD